MFAEEQNCLFYIKLIQCTINHHKGVAEKWRNKRNLCYILDSYRFYLHISCVLYFPQVVLHQSHVFFIYRICNTIKYGSGIWQRKHYIALCAELALEGPMHLSRETK
jgi:hypothetical protein